MHSLLTDTISTAIRIRPNNLSYLSMRALMYHVSGDYESEARDCAEMIKQGANGPAHLLRTCLAFMRMGDFVNARKYCNMVSSLSVTDASVVRTPIFCSVFEPHF